MKEFLNNSVYFGVFLSLLGYAIGIILKKKFKSNIFNPLLISIIFVITVLVVFHIDYKAYNSGAKVLSYMLTPATVCLAIPLYQQLELIKNHFKAIMAGIIAGVLSSLSSVLFLAYLFGLDHKQYVTLLPKSITTAIGMGISEELGGITTITVAVIIITGVLGHVLADIVFKIFSINEPLAVGLALGTSSHAIGTTKALEIGEIEGAMSSLSIVVAGLLTVIGASVFSNFL